MPTLPNGLQELECFNNKFTVLPVLPNNLQRLRCENNQLIVLPMLPSGLWSLNCSNNQLTTLPALSSGLHSLDCNNNQLTALPELPSALAWLLCSNNQLTSLPNLPSGLLTLICSNNQLAALPALSSGVQYLDCNNNKLTALPTLSSVLWLWYLDCSNNQLNTLPTLPSRLGSLSCGFNQLSTLPMLPSGLGSLSCGFNQLNTLPALPSGLRSLDCNNNQLTALPTLPSGLYSLSCSFNQLTILPELPSGLKELSCYNNNVYCLPELPDYLFELYIDADKITCLPNELYLSIIFDAHDNSITLPVCSTPVLVTNPSVSDVICIGQAVSLIAKATGNSAMTVKWQRKGIADADFSDIANTSSTYTSGTAAIYTTSTLGTSDNGVMYRAVFTSKCSSFVNSVAATVTVQPYVTCHGSDLQTDIQNLNLSGSLGNSLKTQTTNALNSYNACLLTDAVNQLRAFINTVQSQRGKKIPVAQADALIAQAQALIDYILAYGNPACPSAAPNSILLRGSETTSIGHALFLEAYPNPSDGVVTIRYQIPEESRVTLAVYDLQGRIISTLFNGVQNKGKHQIVWNDFNNTVLPIGAGIYLLRLQTNNDVITRRLIRME